ncbi:MAG TPA: hypothetical protein VGV18_06560 [Verrucomicrobiae bacterium]|nr:hypothetical protein [Verrucomicrobiae bacterium]
MPEDKPHYKWPRYVLAGVIVFLVAAIIWMLIAVRKTEKERNFSAPIQTQ